MEHKVEIVYCDSCKYYIVDNSLNTYRNRYSSELYDNLTKSKCKYDVTIKDNLTREEAETFLLSILKLKGL